MKAKLIEKKEIAEGTLYTKFSLEENIIFKAGQFFKLKLIDPSYTDERGNERFVGFVNSPSDNKVIETVVRKGPSAFKRSLSELIEGTEVEVGEVSGEMLSPEDQNTSWVIVAGGIGIVPYMSMFRVMKEKGLSLDTTLVYSNTKESWVIFMDELGEYAKDDNFKFIPTMTQDDSWEGEKRRIDEEFIKEKVSSLENSLFYISGTPRFVPDMVKAVKNLGVQQRNLKFEVFTGY
ncbi:FAD-dependent oxidoreductase [Candidatus Woesebacteria bacterium]|nr:FAD-dependent oxidoreductase [Candidatus Woesebacteria bacterium]